jgi:DNA-binding LacI/PurR family transcriptional regulator
MVNIIDVAKKAGVSYSTVSHVINKTKFVKEATKKRVLEAIKELNYRPNIMARGFKTGKSYTIGLIVSDISHPFYRLIFDAIQSEAFKYKYDIFLYNTKYSCIKASQHVARLIEKRVDGVIFITYEYELPLALSLISQNIPVATFEGDKTDYLMSNIKENFETGMKQAIDHLISLGHKDIAFIVAQSDVKTIKKRKEAFLGITKKYLNKINKPEVFEIDVTPEMGIAGGIAAAGKILSLTRPPTAVIALADLAATGFLLEAKKRGFNIPEDISIIGFNDRYTEPLLSNIKVPRHEIGQMAWEMINSLIKNKNKKGREMVIDTTLIVRQSTGAVKRNCG